MMNPNVWNIKEILSIPARNASTSGYSSSTDSQRMSGSQLNSQSQEIFSTRNSNLSQQSSEGSDPKFYNNYHTKPLLFGVDGKDVKRAIGALDKFEEDKRRAKEKRESDLIAQERLHLRETLYHIQHSVNDTEKNTAACKTILEGFDSFATALQKNLSSLHNGITQQFEKMLSQLSSQKQLLTEIEEKVLKTGVASTELGSCVKGLEKNMEVLTHEHRREQKMLEEAVTLLNTLVSKHSTKPVPLRVTDNAIQTSPSLTDSAIQTSPGLIGSTIQTSSGLKVSTTQTSPGLTVTDTLNRTAPGLTDSINQTASGLSQTLFNQEQKCRQPENNKRLPLCQIENCQGSEAPSQSRGSSIKVKSSRPTAGRRKANKRRPLLPPQRKKGTIWFENSQTPVDENPRGGLAIDVFGSPHDPKTLVSVKPDPQSKSVVGLKAGPHPESLGNVKPDRQLNSLVKPAPQPKSHQQSDETRSNGGKGGFVTQFNFWSQESTSSPAAVDVLYIDRYQPRPAEAKAGISEKPKGLWQLFDLCHSDPFSVDEE